MSRWIPEIAALAAAKKEGNACYAKKDYEGAIAKYSAGLGTVGGGSRVLAAVLHSNRAAAQSAQGQLLEAAADCLRAHALDPDYLRNVYRLASILCALVRAPHASIALHWTGKNDNITTNLPPLQWSSASLPRCST